MTELAAANRCSCDCATPPAAAAVADPCRLSVSQTAASLLPSSVHALANSRSHDDHAADSTDVQTSTNYKAVHLLKLLQ